LSIEGSQIIGPKCNKNILELKDEQRELWVKGYDLDIDGDLGFVIIKNKDDFLGCGKLRNNKLYNYVPKSRRLMVINE
jgi:NOL1/NOP2/fmu family ribosome biogenesis protein